MLGTFLLGVSATAMLRIDESATVLYLASVLMCTLMFNNVHIQLGLLTKIFIVKMPNISWYVLSRQIQSM